MHSLLEPKSVNTNFPIVEDVLEEMENYHVNVDGLEYIQGDGGYVFNVEEDREYIFNVEGEFKDQLCKTLITLRVLA